MSVRRLLTLKAIVLAVSGTAAAQAAVPPARCDASRLLGHVVARERRAPTAEDLIELVDIGDPAPSFESGALSLSPDRRYLAVPLRRADTRTNSYCLGIVVLDLTSRDEPVLVDTSDEVVRGDFNFRGPLVPEDYPITIQAKWSPDGQWLAYQKSVGGIIELWRVRRDGDDGQRVRGVSGLLEDFVWTDNERIAIKTRSGIGQAEQALAAEEANGWRFDDRFLPLQSDRPFIRTPTTSDYQVVAVAGGIATPATQASRSLIDPVLPAGALKVSRSAAGAVAWTSKVSPDRYGSDTRLDVQVDDHRRLYCDASRCDRIDGLWWSGGKRLVFVRREGWAKSKTGIYVWDLNSASPRRISLDDSFLAGCVLAADRLICAEERALQPRRIVSINIRTGHHEPLFDPNPGFSRLTLGKVTRLYWRNTNGFEVFGDLVLPVTYRAGQHYPMIVTTYHSRGFLRGGTGDEYPIQLFANRGFAVLSSTEPRGVGVNLPGVPTVVEEARVAYRNWSERRSIHSAIERGIRLVDQRGILDPARVGVAGFSDGASSVQFALVNSRLFAAAAISHCCAERETFMSGAAGIQNSDYYQKLGIPALAEKGDKFWQPMSLVHNAKTVVTPLLMQVGAQEFRLALPSYTALRDAQRPVDMFVFDREGHVKLQPVHRLAAYRRSIAWFDFWLRGVRDVGLATSAELDRWERWRSSSAR